MIQRTLTHRNLEEAFFPVHVENIMQYSGRRIPHYRAVVDTERNNVLSVVTENYKLITNERAYQYAGYIISAVFPGMTLDDFTCYNIMMPKTRSFCRIDLIKEKNPYEPFGDRSESWTPFIRITNSYNKTHVLRYEIGFCRWICLNGVIFGAKSFTLTITHTEGKGVDARTIVNNARESIGSITSLWLDLQRNLIAARDFYVPEKMILPMFCKAFDIKIHPKELKPQAMERLSIQASSILSQGREYFRELGSNAYAFFNVLTDFSSYPVGIANAALSTHSYQKRAGQWLQDFIAESEKDGFFLEDYIGDEYMDSALCLESLARVE